LFNKIPSVLSTFSKKRLVGRRINEEQSCLADFKSEITWSTPLPFMGPVDDGIRIAQVKVYYSPILIGWKVRLRF
jgi:hypothetical protein